MRDFAPADDSFAARLPEGIVRPLEPRYLEERRGFFKGAGGLLVAPRSVDEVAAVVRAAAEAGVAVVPYGGGTGLVGGQVMPGARPVIVSLERMTAMRAVYPEENAMVVEAGAVLADVQAAAERADRLFALSLASEGSARIGGLLSTNAGGIHVLRYGNARALCLGLEAVLPDGTIWHGLKRLRKDNTGYDLRDLLIGAEGTLGIITAATLKLHPRPAAHGTAMMTVASPAAALSLLALAQARLGPVLEAFELISGQALRFLAETGLETGPFAEAPDWSVLLETGVGEGMDADGPIEAMFAEAVERGLVGDGVVARSEAQRGKLWRMREEIPEANKRIGSISSHDISLPLSEIPGFLAEAPGVLARFEGLRINAFGHLGDGNLHYNLFPPPGGSRADFAHLREEIATTVYDLVAARGGSFSAEHGVGRLKVDELARYGDPAGRAAMRAIKEALDPGGIMNPGVMFG